MCVCIFPFPPSSIEFFFTHFRTSYFEQRERVPFNVRWVKGVGVVNKPAGIPVHPSGAFHVNSVTSILQHSMKTPMIHPVHRLDRLTSGLLLVCQVTSMTCFFMFTTT